MLVRVLGSFLVPILVFSLVHGLFFFFGLVLFLVLLGSVLGGYFPCLRDSLVIFCCFFFVATMALLLFLFASFLTLSILSPILVPSSCSCSCFYMVCPVC